MKSYSKKKNPYFSLRLSERAAHLPCQLLPQEPLKVLLVTSKLKCGNIFSEGLGFKVLPAPSNDESYKQKVKLVIPCEKKENMP